MRSLMRWRYVGCLAVLSMLLAGCLPRKPAPRVSLWSVCKRSSWQSQCSIWRKRKPKRRKRGPKLRVLTFNVNYGGQPAKALERILEAKAHVVALQETTPYWERWLRPRLKRRYKAIRFAHAPGAGGLAFLSVYPIKSLKRLKPPKGGWFDAWRAELQTPLGKLWMLSVHLRPPLGADGSLSSIPRAYFATRAIRKREVQHYSRYLPRKQPLIVLGDFNENRHGLALRWLRKKRKLHSALPRFDKTTPTWHWPTRYYTFRDRLDHILYSRHLRPIQAHVMADGGSDHFPVLAVFQKR